MNRILLVEDQREFQLIVSRILNDGQQTVTVAETAQAALAEIRKNTFDLILLDISLPDQNGLDFYADLQLVAESQKIPVVFLTGNENSTSKIAAFSMGAEDYITKPFHPQEFKARVLSKIRKNRSQLQNLEEPKIGPFQFKLGSQRVYLNEGQREIELTPKEFKILYFLARHEDNVFSREQLLNEIWGQQTNVTDRTIDSNIYLLRKKLGEHAVHIEAVSGVGYRFCSTPKVRKAVA